MIPKHRDMSISNIAQKTLAYLIKKYSEFVTTTIKEYARRIKSKFCLTTLFMEWLITESFHFNR